MAKRRFWGWGVEGAGPTREQQQQMGETIATRFGAEPRAPIEPPTIEEVELRAPRVAPPESLAHLCTTDPEERAGHNTEHPRREPQDGEREPEPTVPIDQIVQDRTHMQEVDKIHPQIDAAFLPVYRMMPPKDFADTVKAIQPKIVFPYAYGTNDPKELAALLKDNQGIDLRVRDLK